MVAPDALMQDDTYIGFKIPAEATVLINVYESSLLPYSSRSDGCKRGLHTDSPINPNLGILDPSQFGHDLRSKFEYATVCDPLQRRNYIFGAGRRVCQGMHIAERSLFLAVTRLLWAFDFKVPESGSLPDVDDLVGDLTVRPAPSEVGIVTRSEEKKSLVQETWTDVESMLLVGKGQ
jgi:hypothetical protein